MQKFKRIVFCLLITIFLLFECYILSEEFKSFEMINKIKKDPSLLILILLTLFSILSLLFNINKLQKELILNSSFHKILRIGDVIFSISIFIISIFGFYFLIEDLNRTSLEFERQLIIFCVLLCLFFFSMLLFFDNILFQKKQKTIFKKDLIDEIGK